MLKYTKYENIFDTQNKKNKIKTVFESYIEQERIKVTKAIKI